MKLLLDTHVVLWALEDSYRLSPHIREMICDENNQIYVSVASLWEIALKHKKNPDKMIYSATDIRNYCQRAGYIFLSLNIDAVCQIDNHDFFNHKDPFDQILICQSASHNMKLLTHDEKIKQFNIGQVELF